MARIRNAAGTGPDGRGRSRWRAVAVLVGVPALLTCLIVLVAARSSSPDLPGGGPEKVPCEEALSFGGAELPKGAHDARCTVRTWLDTEYAARFRMPRADVRDWLAASYPDAPKPETEYCDSNSVDLCLSLGFDEGAGDYAGDVPGTASPGFGADAVDVDVEYEGAGTALVVFTAFTV